MIGETIDGRYKVVRLIGEGGMGAVYEARHTATKRRVALKLITENLARDNSERLQRFRREAKAAGRIDSDHITQVFDLGTDPERGLPYMAMEYLEGEDLEDLFDRIGRLPTDLALRVVAQALQGLAMAHEAGVVHRDIKPANIFLSRRDMGRRVVKLLDFGIAKIRHGQSPLTSSSPTSANEITGTGVLIGSPIYMSPEQTKGLRDLDPRTDVWSMGVVMYQALAGFTPHDDSEGIGDLILSINTKEVKVRERAPWVPPVVAQVVEKALTVSGKERFQDAREMLAAVQHLVEDSRIEQAMVDAAATPPPEPDPEEMIDELAATRPSYEGTGPGGDTLEVELPKIDLDRPPTVEVAVQSAAPASARLEVVPSSAQPPTLNEEEEVSTQPRAPRVPKPGASTTGPIVSPRVVGPPPASPWPKRAVAAAAIVFLSSGVVLLLDRDEPGEAEPAAPPSAVTASAAPPGPTATATASASASATASAETTAETTAAPSSDEDKPPSPKTAEPTTPAPKTPKPKPPEPTAPEPKAPKPEPPKEVEPPPATPPEPTAEATPPAETAPPAEAPPPVEEPPPPPPPADPPPASPPTPPPADAPPVKSDL